MEGSLECDSGVWVFNFFVGKRGKREREWEGEFIVFFEFVYFLSYGFYGLVGILNVKLFKVF